MENESQLEAPRGIQGKFTRSEFQPLGSWRPGDRLDHQEECQAIVPGVMTRNWGAGGGGNGIYFAES